MLSKLIGYEFKATRRIFLPAYLAILVLSVINAATLALSARTDKVTIPFGILITLYIFAMFAVCVLSFAYMIYRFNKNLLGDEGYLMFTLPARPGALIWAKCIVSTVWMVASAVLCVLSLCIIMLPVMSVENIPWGEILPAIRQGVDQLFQQFGANVVLVPIEVIVGVILWVMNFCMHIYACLSLGSLANRHRLAWAFGAYVAFGVAEQIIASICMVVGNQFNLAPLLSLLNGSAGSQLSILGILAFLACALIVNYVIANYILSKRLNLQ